MKCIGQAELGCLATKETAPHALACKGRIEWQGAFIHSLRRLLAKTRAQPDLQMTLLLGVSGALQDDPTLEMSTNNRKADFEILVSSQNDAGWAQLLRGRFCHHWVQIEQARIDKEDEICSTTNSGSGWLEKAPHHVLSHLHDAWNLLRNADLQKRKAKVGPAIVALHQASATLDHLEKAFLPFHSTIVSLKTLPSKPHGSAWLHPPCAKPRPKPTFISATLSATSANSSSDPFQHVGHFLMWPSLNGFQFLDSATVSVSCRRCILHFEN
jgi:hypothetical protein